jgi:hypothetical protein
MLIHSFSLNVGSEDEFNERSNACCWNDDLMKRDDKKGECLLSASFFFFFDIQLAFGTFVDISMKLLGDHGCCLFTHSLLLPE